MDKPRLFLNEQDFLAENHNAYRITGDRLSDRSRSSATVTRAARRSLTRENGHLLYECPEVHVTLTPAFEVQSWWPRQPFAGALSLRDAAEMAVLLEGVSETLPHLTE